MLKNTQNSYGSIAKGFHWLLFLMMTFSVVAGNFLASLPKGQEKFEAAGMHKSFGAVILMLIILRLAWRLMNETPKDPEGTSKTQSLMARTMHWVLYGLMFAQPLSGIFMSQAAGFPVNFFGMFEFPVLLSKNPDMAAFFLSAHRTIWIVLAITVIGHIGAAMQHHFVKKDVTLKRMVFGTRA